MLSGLPAVWDLLEFFLWFLWWVGVLVGRLFLLAFFLGGRVVGAMTVVALSVLDC